MSSLRNTVILSLNKCTFQHVLCWDLGTWTCSCKKGQRPWVSRCAVSFCSCRPMIYHRYLPQSQPGYKINFSLLKGDANQFKLLVPEQLRDLFSHRHHGQQPHLRSWIKSNMSRKVSYQTLGCNVNPALSSTGGQSWARELHCLD